MRVAWSPADPQSYAEARVGTYLRQKWRLDRLIGIGGMAAVYAATHRTGHRAAIKILHAQLASLDEVRQRFVQEPYIANRIAHAGVVRVLDDDVAEDGAPFVVLELLEGETLDERWRMQGGRMPPEEVCWVADQILDILASAHAVGVLHRDVKPHNGFITQEGMLKLFDFGVARIASATAALTQMGGVLGSPAFMPPEQARGQWDMVRETADLWAVGATMFALLTGHFVHEASNAVDFLLAAIQPARSITTLAVGLPGGLCHVIDRALAYAPGDRWPSARAMQAALAAALRQEHTAVIAPPAVAQSHVGPTGTMLHRGSFPIWSPAPPGATPPPAPDPLAPPAARAPELSGLWYVSDGVNVVGPVSLDLLRRGIAAGRVPDDSVVCHASWSEWRRLEDVMDIVAPEEATSKLPILRMR